MPLTPQIPVDPNAKFVINLFFWMVNYDEGFTPSALGVIYDEEEALDAVRVLNVHYNVHNIFFKYNGYEIVNNTSMTNAESNLPNGKADSFNLYFVANASGNSAYAIEVNTKSVYSMNALESIYYEQILVHEIGHCLSLLHVQNNSNASNCEHVERNPMSPNYNANVAGDFVADTPAQALMSTFNFDNNCEYIYDTSLTDCIGRPYEAIIPSNYMGYDANSTCPKHFSPGQAQRMRNYLQNNTFPHYPLTYNTIESLYEPFYMNVAAGNTIYSIDEQLDGGGAMVCRNQIVKLRFQPGFNYEFSETTQGTIFQNVNQQFNYDNYMDHFIGVKIPIISNEDTYMIGGMSSIFPYLCNLEPYVSGNILSSVWIGSNNITIKELNEIEVNNPELYDELMQNYYHIIRKYTSTGIKVEKIIYKN